MKKLPVLRRLLTLLLALMLICAAVPQAFASEVGTPEETPSATDPPEQNTEPPEAPTEEPIEAAPTAPVTEPVETSEPPEEPAEPTEPTEPAPVAEKPPEDAAAPGDESPTEPPPMEANGLEVIGSVGRYNQKAVIWTTNGDTVTYTFNGKTTTSGREDIHRVYYDGSYHMSYCVQPGTSIPNPDSDWYAGEPGADDNWLKSLSNDQRRTIGLVLLYGAPNDLYSGNAREELAFELATQVIIHEICVGWRSPTGTYARTNDGYYNVYITGGILSITSDDSALDGRYLQTYAANSGLTRDETAILKAIAAKDPTNCDRVYYAYRYIEEKLKDHGTYPSFTGASIDRAPRYSLTANGDGSYGVTLTDTNNILPAYDFSACNTAQVTFTASGNTLTVRSTVQNPGITVAPTRVLPSADSSGFLLWNTGKGDQEQITLAAARNDPVPAYFKLGEEYGSLTIEKTSTNGAGSDQEFNFRIYHMPDGAYVDRTLKVGESVTLTELSAGTYIVGEWFVSGWECTNAEAVTVDQYRWTVTVPAGGSVTVTANNEPTVGTGMFIKSTSTGANLDGWTINIYTDEACTQLYTSVVTGTDGTVSADFPSGTYYAKEAATDDPYWVCDSRIVRFVITPGATTQVRFENTHMGKIRLVKTTSDGANLSGWQFELYRDADCTDLVGSYVSAGDGTVTTENLPPAVYYAQETGNIDPEISALYACAEGVQAVTVEAGKTAEVTLRSGSKAFSRKLNCLRTSGSS